MPSVSRPPGDEAPVNPPAVPARPAARGPGQGRGRRGYRLVRHFKLDHRLTPDDRAAYEQVLRDPRTTIDALLKWLHARGYSDMTRGGVHRHRRHFEHIAGAIRRDVKVATIFANVARDVGGVDALYAAAQYHLERMFLAQLFRMNKSDDRSAKEWLELGKVIETILHNRDLIDDQRAAVRDLERHPPTPARPRPKESPPCDPNNN